MSRNVPEESLIHIQGLNHWFGEGEFKRQVLFENELEISPGELVLMTGPSGSGKTTLLTLVGGLRSVQAGSVAVDGLELAGLDHRGLVRHRQRIGFIFQQHNLFPALTAFQNVLLALDLQPMEVPQKRELARDILVRLGLEHRIHAKPQHMSGGQRQRVAIARALVHRPRVILADEPTAALDKETSRDVVDLLRVLVQEEGCTILLVTHDDRIVDVADRIVSMVDGQILTDVRLKESEEICNTLQGISLFSEYSDSLITEMARKMKRLRFSPGSAIIEEGEEGDAFYVLVKGVVTVEREGMANPVAELKAGDFFGERALITDEPRNATVRAREPVIAYALPKPVFDEALAEGTSFRRQITQAALHRSS